MIDRTLEDIDQQQREEKPLKLALIENARLCRELERQLRQKDIELKKQEQMAKLGEAVLNAITNNRRNGWTTGICMHMAKKIDDKHGCTNCEWQDFCKLRKEMGK